jgi:hypothetical protein
MGRINIVEQVEQAEAEEQRIARDLINAKLNECIDSGYNYKIVIDVQRHRISGIQATDFISGISQYTYQLDKLV